MANLEESSRPVTLGRTIRLELAIDLDGLKTVVEIYAEQTGMEGTIPNPEKYVDMSYLKQALKELGWR